MTTEPTKALSGALHDPSRWIRLGAARAAPWLAPKGAAEILTTRAAAIAHSLPVDETSTISVALARAGGDPLPLLAGLLQDNVGDLQSALDDDYGKWADYVNERISVSPLTGSFRPLESFFAAWAGREHFAEWRKNPAIESDASASRASAALYNFRFWERAATGNGNNWMKALVEETFAPALEQLSAGRAAEAVAPLVRVALAAPNGWMRLIAQKTLPSLGSDASAPLLSALAGDPAILPDGDVFDSIARESDDPLPEGMTPDKLAAFLAGEALEGFSDTETAFAAVNAAIAWQPEARIRAARVVARMSAEVALPSLAWCAANLPSALERDTATHLLDRIVASDPALGMRLHHVQHTELKPNQLGWLSEIVSERSSARDWMSDPSVCIPVLREAITVMPDIVGDAGFVYSEPPTAVMASNFMKSISGLRGWFGGALPATVRPRLPQITLPGQCQRDIDITLSVQLLLPMTDDSAPTIDVGFPKGQEEVELLVLIHAPGFLTPVDHKTMRVARDKPSEVATFVLNPHILGEQAIDIKFMLGTAIVGQCCAVTVVKTELSGDKAATTMLLDPVGDFAQLQDAAQAVLRVKSRPDGTLEWSLQKPETGLKPLGLSTTSIGASEAATLGTRQKPLIKQMLENELSEPDLIAVLLDLSILGYGLFAQIAPPTLAAELDALQENALVVIDSDADWIPWELLASDPTGELWGQRFVLIRAPVMTRPPIAKFAKPGELPQALKSALLVVGDDIQQPTRLASLTFRGMAKRAELVLRADNLTKLCASVAGKDIVHFACHGRSEPNYHLSFKEGIGGYLLPGHAHSLGLKWGAVVFANACSSATNDLLLAAFQSFGREFYYAGARPFIGTLGPVPEKEAAEFAGLFYEQFAFAGLPAGQAMRRAKQEGRSKFKRPIWLFYCLYGNPSVVRRWSPVRGG